MPGIGFVESMGFPAETGSATMISRARKASVLSCHCRHCAAQRVCFCSLQLFFRICTGEGSHYECEGVQSCMEFIGLAVWRQPQVPCIRSAPCNGGALVTFHPCM